MQETAIQTPIARRQKTETTVLGHCLVDDYAWLRDKNAPEVLAYLEQENVFTNSLMRPTQELQDLLYREMLSHVKEADVSVPFKEGDYYYYSRTEESKQYPIYCRKHLTLDDTEEVILDVNQLATGQPFMALGAFSVSDDGTLLAYSTDNTGFRQYTLHIKNLKTGVETSGHAERTGSVEWASDNHTLFYSVEDDQTKRQYQLFRHTLGSPRSDDTLVFEETDERFNIGIDRTRDGKYLLLECGSHTTSDVRFLPASRTSDAWTLLEPRRENIEYSADHRDGRFFLRINDTGRTFRIVSVAVNQLDRENWIELLPNRADVMLEDLDLFADFAVITERRAGLPHLRVLTFGEEGAFGHETREIEFPEPAYTTHPHINREFSTAKFRYAYQSLVSPSSVFEYDVSTGHSTLLKELEIPGGFDRKLYRSERIFARADDGAQIPVSLVYRIDKKRNGANPLYIYGYGAYGYPLPLGFNSNRLSLLDRGFVLTYAHVRGGGDLGKPWHDAGRLLHKMNTFTDFISVTQHLIANGYGDPNRVAIEGGSAGGLLMGAVVNMRPDLFRAVASHVPFVDVINTMLDADLPLTVAEYEEWGNPNVKEYLEYMLQYSPYDNLKSGAYPAMLVKTSLHDSQVMYWEPAKYVAKLRTLKSDDKVLLLQTNMSAGHGGASGRYDHLKEIAFDYAFFLRELGVET